MLCRNIIHSKVLRKRQVSGGQAGLMRRAECRLITASQTWNWVTFCDPATQ